ncbi:MAG TPA: hypothetical protein VG797_04505 [Phycisphaerales bacterium]|nr:hypothetical protein [Phycisphaerales bacterium]
MAAELAPDPVPALGASPQAIGPGEPGVGALPGSAPLVEGAPAGIGDSEQSESERIEQVRAAFIELLDRLPSYPSERVTDLLREVKAARKNWDRESNELLAALLVQEFTDRVRATEL